MLEQDLVQIGRFRILRRLGEGGMGVVYVGYDNTLEREVAIKLLRAEAARATALLREARGAARVKHPNVCTIYEVGEHEGVPFLVMELLEGETVAARLDNGPRDPYEACDLVVPTSTRLKRCIRNGSFISMSSPPTSSSPHMA